MIFFYGPYTEVIHSGYFYSTSSSPLLLMGAPDYSIDTVSELTRRSSIQTTVGEGLAQGSCMATRVGLELPTFRAKDTELTTEPPAPDHL